MEAQIQVVLFLPATLYYYSLSNIGMMPAFKSGHLYLLRAYV